MVRIWGTVMSIVKTDMAPSSRRSSVSVLESVLRQIIGSIAMATSADGIFARALSAPAVRNFLTYRLRRGCELVVVARTPATTDKSTSLDSAYRDYLRAAGFLYAVL